MDLASSSSASIALSSEPFFALGLGLNFGSASADAVLALEESESPLLGDQKSEPDAFNSSENKTSAPIKVKIKGTLTSSSLLSSPSILETL